VALGEESQVLEASSKDSIFEIDTIAVEKLSTVLSRHILPLFETYRGKPSLCGSGLLVSCESGSFLISAAHVFDPLKDGRDLFFYVEASTTRNLSGKLALTTFHGKDRNSDRVDVGVLRLEGRGLPPYRKVDKYPLPLESLLPGALPRENKRYLVVGFPGSQSRANPVGRQVTSKAYSFLNISAPTEKYAEIRVAPESHIVISFSRKRVVGPTGCVQMFPNPRGMSGSPVWLHEGESQDPSRSSVVGITIEHCRSQRAIVAADIGVAVNVIREAF
jgi:hypothetical protein